MVEKDFETNLAEGGKILFRYLKSQAFSSNIFLKEIQFSLDEKIQVLTQFFKVVIP